MNILQRGINRIKAFGWKGACYLTAIQAGRAVFKFKDENTVKRVTVNLVKQQVCFRPGTSDLDLLFAFFYDFGLPLQYDFDFLSYLRGEKLRYVVDAGANIGLFSLVCDEKYMPKTIIAIEPDQTNYELLKVNTSDRESVICKLGGVWPRRSYLKTIQSPMGKYGITVEECDEANSDCIGYSILELMEQYRLPYLDLVKMDVEGSEYDIFNDDACEMWIRKTSLLIVETHDRKKEGSERVVVERMQKLGFSSFRHGEDIVFFRPELCDKE